jgi:hypothetical protein
MLDDILHYETSSTSGICCTAGVGVDRCITGVSDAQAAGMEQHPASLDPLSPQRAVAPLRRPEVISSGFAFRTLA